MKKATLALVLVLGVLTSATSAWAQAPLPKVRLEGLPMLSLAAANVPAQTGARDDLPDLTRLQRGRRWTAAGVGLLAGSALVFAVFGRKNYCDPYEFPSRRLTTPYVVGSSLAAAGLAFTIPGIHRIRHSRDELKHGSLWKRWFAPLSLATGVAALALPTSFAIGFREWFSQCPNS